MIMEQWDALKAKCEGLEQDNNLLSISIGARRGQYDRQTNRLASAGLKIAELQTRVSSCGLLIDDLREAASKERARADLRYQALKNDIRDIADLSAGWRMTDIFEDVVRIHRIATKG